MTSCVKVMASAAVFAVASVANAQYPAQPAPYPQPAPAAQCAPAVRPHWSPFAWLTRPKPNTAPSLKRPEYPLGFPQSPYVRSPRDYFMQE
jgi:hypothetical protein